MNLEVGKVYVTKDGRKGKVVGKLDKNFSEVSGDYAVQIDDTLMRYMGDGRWNHHTTVPDEDDLVAEYREPIVHERIGPPSVS